MQLFKLSQINLVIKFVKSGNTYVFNLLVFIEEDCFRFAKMLYGISFITFNTEIFRNTFHISFSGIAI